MTDAEAFERFVREYQQMVFATAIRLLGHAADAEDIAQAVFMKAYQRFDDVVRSATAAGWLKTTTTNACLNHLTRHRKRWRLFSEMESGQPDAVPFESTLAAPETPPADPQTVEPERLERALRALPDHQRVPLVLFHFEAQSYQQIATTLGVSLGKIKTDIHRGREVLRRALTGTDDAP